jgi:alpha-glucosidase (family GH31 glycosyl hydrolase)
MRFLLIIISFIISAKLWANPYVVKNSTHDLQLKIELLEMGGAHFEISRPDEHITKRIWTSPMVLTDVLKLSKAKQTSSTTFEDQHIVIKVDNNSLCSSVFDKKQNKMLAQVCPRKFHEAWKGLDIHTEIKDNLYGLGQYFTNPGTADGDLRGRIWDPLYNTHGNALRSFSKGANSYAMFPVLYAMGEQDENFLFFFDHLYKQMWTLTGHPLKVDSYGDQFRWFIVSATNINELRKKYMQLSGKPPIPPKNIFGLWISEFGYESWHELDQEIDHLKKNGFPLDGAALDLQWFGGRFYEGNVDRSSSRFGTLTFDEINFPSPRQKIADYKNNLGLSLMAIEESYISKYLPEHQELAKQGFLATYCNTTTAAELTDNPWWGIGGMIDWTNPMAQKYWHATKRQKLVELGITHHWTDLGEPEMYHEDSCYFGFPELGKHKHRDIHNLYNFKWLESIAEGYQAFKNKERPFMMSRSGTSGIQRFGAAVWSGDIGANMGAMTAHYNAQMHMTFSGIDYYGADIGGFHRSNYSLDGDADELFTQWFANAALFDFPIRSHTWNLANNLATSPSKIGDVKSNLANIQLRYQLFPYYYSLAHMAHLEGEAIIRPLALSFPHEKKARNLGNQKMIGPFMMAAMIANYGEKERKVFLPKSVWFNFHTGEKYNGQSDYGPEISAYPQGHFQIPLLIKAGAIIPMIDIHSSRLNISGKRSDGNKDKTLSLLISPDEQESNFTFYDDNAQRITQITQKILISQRKSGSQSQLVIETHQLSDIERIKFTVYHEKIAKIVFEGKEIKFIKEKKNIFKTEEMKLKPNQKYILQLYH